MLMHRRSVQHIGAVWFRVVQLSLLCRYQRGPGAGQVPVPEWRRYISQGHTPEDRRIRQKSSPTGFGPVGQSPLIVRLLAAEVDASGQGPTRRRIPTWTSAAAYPSDPVHSLSKVAVTLQAYLAHHRRALRAPGLTGRILKRVDFV